MPTQTESHHGVLMCLSGKGLFITGPAGIGKSSLAIDLLQHGHQLIADDIVEFSLENNNQVIGQCPEILAGLLHSRELGLFSVIDTFGSEAWLKTSPLDYVIELSNSHQPESTLEPINQYHSICEKKIPKLILNPQSTSSLYSRLLTWLKINSAPNKAYQLIKQRQQKIMV